MLGFVTSVHAILNQNFLHLLACVTFFKRYFSSENHPDLKFLKVRTILHEQGVEICDCFTFEKLQTFFRSWLLSEYETSKKNENVLQLNVFFVSTYSQL